MNKFSVWITAARLRTLPLSSSGVILGGCLAANAGYFHISIFLLSVASAVLLQILSNFANDYGDAVKGSDGPGRVGPRRSVASGEISQSDMRAGIILTAFSCVLAIILLLCVSFGHDPLKWGIFLALGAASILAAIFYTMGRHPYGYMGLGDLFVFIFFGLVAVAGAYALYGAPMSHLPWLPASATGLFATSVLNVNNIRDMENDSRNGKKTLALRLGVKQSRIYNLCLVGCGLLCWAVWLVGNNLSIGLLCMIAAVPLIRSAWTVYGSEDAKCLDGQLRATSISSGLFNIVMGIFLLLA